VTDPAIQARLPKRFAYADPPYLGTSKFDAAHHYGKHHPNAADYNEISTHRALIKRLNTDFDGWAMSLSSPSLRLILPLCPDDCRVAAWVKPFASFKPGVNPGYCWEPVIFRGARARRERTEPTVRDFVSENIMLKKGLAGAKPPGFCEWVLNLLGVRDCDEFTDIFPGTGVMDRVRAQGVLL
jgi:hypothetical protein